MVGPEVVTSEGFRLYNHKSENKKFAPTVVFIHHMWGNNKSTWRHYRYLNEKGFDCVSFDLLFGSDKLGFSDLHPMMKYFYKGVFYVWAKQIRSILNDIEGDKIVYAFSGPSLSAFWACAGRSDIKKFVCDGGPFENIYENSRNFFYHELGITSPWLNKLITFLGSVIWGIGPLVKLHKVLKNWAQAIPILSIRGVRDDIVEIDSIRSVFKPHSKLNLLELEIMHGKHLDGIRDFPDQYCKTLLPFLKQNLEPPK